MCLQTPHPNSIILCSNEAVLLILVNSESYNGWGLFDKCLIKMLFKIIRTNPVTTTFNSLPRRLYDTYLVNRQLKQFSRLLSIPEHGSWSPQSRLHCRCGHARQHSKNDFHLLSTKQILTTMEKFPRASPQTNLWPWLGKKSATENLSWEILRGSMGSSPDFLSTSNT